jgi:hypothetical protein
LGGGEVAGLAGCWQAAVGFLLFAFRFSLFAIWEVQFTMFDFAPLAFFFSRKNFPQS